MVRSIGKYIIWLGIALACESVIAPTTQASDVPEHLVFGIKTEIPMFDGDKSRKDYYMNIGTDQGIKKNSILDVYRSVTSSDNINNRSSRNITFVIARVRVIHVENDIAVGRMIEFLPPSEVPIGESNNIMIGDRVAISLRK